MSTNVYGLAAQFETSEALLAAARKVYERGFRRVEVYSPIPLPEVEDIFAHSNFLPALVFCGGALGALTGYLLPTYIAVYHYPLNVGGRPLHSWPAFVVIIFELTVLFASATAFFGTLFLNGLPAPFHPVMRAESFTRATVDRYLLCIEARDPIFATAYPEEFLSTLGPERVDWIER